MSNEFTRDPRLADGIGKALTQAREAAGIATARELAEMTGLTRPRISRVEGGRARPRPDEIEKWALAAKLGKDQLQRLLDTLAEYDAWRADLDGRIRYGIAGDEISYTDTFKATNEVHSFALTELPGFLQITEYARAAVEITAPDAPGDERNEAVMARLERAQYLEDDKKTFKVVLAEPSLRWMPCSADVMRSQIGHLFKFLKSAHVELWILPLTSRPDVIPRQGFTVHDRQFVVVDMFGGAATFRQREPLMYLELMSKLTASAVRGDAARELLSAAISAVPAR